MPGAGRGDGDPLDICVISERPISKTEILLHARVIGGLPMLDNEEADDKIIATLANDPIWSQAEDITALPDSLIERLRHYFMTYKLIPGEKSTVSIGEAYGFEHASQVIAASIEDYDTEFGAE